MTLEQQIINFAKGQLHRKVNTGTCGDLIYMALKSAGAKTFVDYGETVSTKTDYTWGDYVSSNFKDAKRGYLIQLRDVTVEQDGYYVTYPQHSAIVRGFFRDKKGKKQGLLVYEQNQNDAPANRMVRKAVMMLGNEKPGTFGSYWIYKPVKK